tara:strand:- start:175 stop:714 length:540 start_codon:yes stop_codon:yes gene_type:complete
MKQAIAFIVLSLFSLSTFALTPDQIHKISIGWHAPYNDVTIEHAYQIANSSRYTTTPNYDEQSAFVKPDLLHEFDIRRRTTREQWLTFWTYQLLDIYTTSRALEYDCIKEANPLFTSNPSDTRLFVTKSALLFPALIYADGWQKVTPRELKTTNVLYTFVIVNNYMLLNDAKKNCNKIR